MKKSKCICEIISSEFSSTLSKIELECALDLRVDSKILLDLAMVAECSVNKLQHNREKETDEIPIPKVNYNDQTTGASSSEIIPDSTALPTPEYYHIKITVRNWPDQSTRQYDGQSDPYLQFFVDGNRIYGGKKHAKSGQIQKTLNNTVFWSINIAAKKIKNSKILKIEWFDKDEDVRFDYDDYIGTTEFSTLSLLGKEFLEYETDFCNLVDLPVKGKKAGKALVEISLDRVEGDLINVAKSNKNISGSQKSLVSVNDWSGIGDSDTISTDSTL